MRGGWASLIGSPQCLSLRSWLLVTPVGIVAAPLAATSATSDANQAVRWMIIGLVAQFPMGLVMAIGNRLAGHLRSPRSVTIVVVLLAGAARGLTIALLGQSQDAVTRTISSAVTMAIWLLVIGAALASRDRYRREVDGLLSMLVARELHGRLLDESAVSAARAASSERLAETSEELRAIVGEESQDHARTAALLQEAIETRLRPLSHDLWFRPRPVAPQAHGRRDLLGRVLTAEVPAVPMTAAGVVLLAWGSLVLHGAWQGALVGITVALTYGAALAVAHALRTRPRAAATVRYLGVLVVPALAGEAAITALGLGQPLSPIPVALGLPLITVGVAAAMTMSVDRARTISDLRARLAEPDWDRHLGELMRGEVDAATATWLHNSVQPVLTAAALQLQLAAELDDPTRAHAALHRARRAIDEASSQDSSPSDGRLRLTSAAEAWSGIADVDLRLPGEDVSTSEWSLLADVVHESIANAVRHGGASLITVTIGVDPQSLTVTVADNGRREVAAREHGLGSTWLASVARSTEAETRPEGGRSMTLHLPRRAVTAG
jgi:signal transduction histidine kinase